AYGGAGVLKSVNGGSTWGLLASGLFTGKAFSGLIVNPANPDVLLGSVTGGIAGRGGEQPPSQPGCGVFKSTNGRTNWVQKVVGFGMDLRADPGNFNHQVAAVSPNGYTGFALEQSLNGGDNWTAINGPWVAPGGVGRMQVAIASSNPNTLYVGVMDGNNN